MYYDGQIVHDLDNDCPFKVGDGSSTFAWGNLPNNSTNYIDLKGELFLPKSIEEAKDLLKSGIILPEKHLPITPITQEEITEMVKRINKRLDSR
jgi:hypothetical protein